MAKVILLSILILFGMGVVFNSCTKSVDNSADIASLKASIQALQSRCDSLSQALNTTNANVALLGTSIDSIKIQLAVINTKIVQLDAELNTVNADISSINAEIAQLNQEYASLLAELNYLISQLNVPPGTLSNGLVAWYPFSGNAVDSSGYGNNGTVSGATLTTDRFGKPNSAYSFNGISSYITVPASSSQNIYGSQQAMTISVWVLKNDTSAGDIFNKGWYSSVATLGNRYFNLGYSTSPSVNSYTLSLYNYSTLNSASSPNASINTSQWYHLVIIRDVAMKFYVNGIDVTTNPNNSGWTTDYNLVLNNIPITIGARDNLDAASNPFYNYFFNGKIDEIRIYNRALNQTEITYLATH
jgi:hypothetical protein